MERKDLTLIASELGLSGTEISNITSMKNYPDRWSIEMLDTLLRKKKLTQAEYDAIIEAKGRKDE